MKLFTGIIQFYGGEYLSQKINIFNQISLKKDYRSNWISTIIG